MSNISALIDVFRMTEVSPKARERIIRELGIAINHSLGMNITQELVVELVLALDPESKIKEEPHYAGYVE